MFQDTGREGVTGVVFFYGLEAVAVASYCAVPAFFEEELGLGFGRVSVVSEYRSNVHLELDSHLVEVLVACLGQVAVALGMGEKRMVARFLKVAEGVVEARWWVPGRCLDEDCVAFHGEEVASLEACVEEVVEHVLRCEVEAYAAVICLLEFFEAQTEGVCCVRCVLHYVRSTPYVRNASLFLKCKHCKGIFKSGNAIIHTV